MNPNKVKTRASEILIKRGIKPDLSPQACAVIEAICELGANSSAERIMKERHLKRIEDKLETIRGQFPLPKDSPMMMEYKNLKAIRLQLLADLDWKA